MIKKMKHLKRMMLALLVVMTTTLSAQVTTSSMSGRVVSGGEAVIGASVVVKHEPSGTTYGTVTNTDGRFNFMGKIGRAHV